MILTKQIIFIVLIFTVTVLGDRLVRTPIVAKTAKHYIEDQQPSDLYGSTLTSAKGIATSDNGSSSASSSQSSPSNFDVKPLSSEFGPIGSSLSVGGATANSVGQDTKMTQESGLNSIEANLNSNAASLASSSNPTNNNAANLDGTISGSLAQHLDGLNNGSAQSDASTKLDKLDGSSSSHDALDTNEKTDSVKSGWLQHFGQGSVQSSDSSGIQASWGASIGSEIHGSWGTSSNKLSSAQGSLSGSLGEGSPGQGIPGHGSPGHGSPGHGSPGHGSPGHGSPGHGSPGHGSPGHGSWGGSSDEDESEDSSEHHGPSGPHRPPGHHGPSGGKGIVSTQCLNCMCSSFKDCIKSTTSCGSGFCGLFKITQPFWVDAGKCTVDGEEPNHPHAFNNCAKNINCVIRSIQGYMKRFKQDCNNDGYIDCIDFASILKFGGHGCRGNRLEESTSKKIQRCTARRTAAPFDSSFDSSENDGSSGQFNIRSSLGYAPGSSDSDNLSGSFGSENVSDSSANQGLPGPNDSLGAALQASSGQASSLIGNFNAQNASGTSDGYSTSPIRLDTTEDKSGSQDLVSTRCLNCMCASFTECTKSGESCSSGFCGLFKITKQYWVEGGKQTVDGDDSNSADAYENCSKDVKCVTKSIQGYMKLFKQDCNNDGNVDCLDYAIIQKFGGYDCSKGKLEESIKNAIKACASQQLVTYY